MSALKKQFSVIVPFFNAETHIEACIRGLLEQTYPEDRYEIIMIDNNSSDASADIVRQFPQIRLLSESTQGAYAARNTGLNEAVGTIIAFTDPDCIPLDDWLDRINEALSAPDVDIVIGSHQPPPGSGMVAMLAAHRHEQSRYIFNGDDRLIYFGLCNNMAVRRTVFHVQGPFVERARGADTLMVLEYTARCSCRGVRYIPEVAVRHLETVSLRGHYRKFFVHGANSSRVRDDAEGRIITRRERNIIIRRTVQNQNYGWVKSLILLVLLFCGSILWAAGVFYARRHAYDPVGGDSE